MKEVADYLQRIERTADVEPPPDSSSHTIEELEAAHEEHRERLEEQAQELTRLLNFAGHYRALLIEALEGEEAP